MSTTGSSSIESSSFEQMETCDSFSWSDTDILYGVFDNLTPCDEIGLGNLMSYDETGLFSDETKIEIVVQPVDKFRFRYKSEMTGTHGRLFGETDDSSRKKEFPTVKLINCPHPDAIIRCTLVTADEEERLSHAHRLVKKYENEDKDGPHDIKVSNQNDYTASFSNMGIIHTAKKDVKEEITKKLRIELLDEKKRRGLKNLDRTTKENWEIGEQAKKAQKSMNLNTVCLCFQGFHYNEDNVLVPLTKKIYSRPINNLKSAKTGELRICRIDKLTSSCKGSEEIWLLVEKVDKKNIKVQFYEVGEGDEEVWEREGKFSELDVHHQYAIVVKTPPYKNTNIIKPVEVFIRLVRPTDGEVSNSMKFVYNPSEKNFSRKRPRVESTSTSLEIASNTTPADQLHNDCLPETLMTLPADENSSLSQELQIFNNENDSGFNSEEGNYFMNTPDLDKLITITVAEDGEIYYNNLVPDGVASKSMINCQDFAVETLKKIFSIYKEMGSNHKMQYSKMGIKSLLSETGNFGDTPLHFALHVGQFEVAKCILACIATDPIFKSTIDLQNETGKTPLHVAAYQDQSEIVKALLNLGADPNIGDEEDATPLHIAVIAEANSSIHELLQMKNKLDLEAHDESGWSALHLAVRSGSLYAVKALIGAGADVNGIDMSYGRTVLHIAVECDHVHIVTYLLTETEVDVNTKNLGGNTALHTAVAKGSKYAEEFVKILREHGADPNIRNNNTDREEGQEDHISIPLTTHSTEDGSATGMATKNIENDGCDEEITEVGESSFDLARDDPKLMALLGQQKPQISVSEETCDLKEEFRDEMMRLGDEKVTDSHIELVKVFLDRSDGWKKLAQHTNNKSLEQLYRKTSSPSSALLRQIQQQRPELTVKQLKKLLTEIEAHEAATVLNDM